MTLRLLSCTPAGLAITLGLLWIMHTLLVDGAPLALTPGPRLPGVFLVEHKPAPPPPPPEARPPQRIPPPAALPAGRPGATRAQPTGIELPQGPVAGLPAGGTPGTELLDPAHADGALISIVKIAPAYPAAALARGIEGYVTVQFDVAADGSVGNVTVVASSHALFEKPAVRAAYRFRFKPRVVDGIAQPSYGVRNRFRFRTSEE